MNKTILYTSNPQLFPDYYMQLGEHVSLSLYPNHHHPYQTVVEQSPQDYHQQLKRKQLPHANQNGHCNNNIATVIKSSENQVEPQMKRFITLLMEQ